LIPVLGILLYQIISRSRRQRNPADSRHSSTPIWPGLDSEFYQFERQLVANGFHRHPGEPLSEWLARSLKKTERERIQQPLQKLLQLHYRYRFDPGGLNASEREQLRLNAEECLALVRES
jgi:hypothetical protein